MQRLLTTVIVRTKGANFSFTSFCYEAHFDSSEFSNEANFSVANFSGKANFRRAKFFDRAYFSGKFMGRTYFDHVLFEDGKKINFDLKDLSNVSFTDTDITRVRFDENVYWGKREKDEERKNPQEPCM